MAALTNVAALSASFVQFTTNDAQTEDTFEQVNEAIKQGTLSTYLEKADPVQLATDLSKNWDKAPYLEILEICDAKIAAPLLSALTASNMLTSHSGVHHAARALNAFNSRERLPVFIDVLKLGLNVFDLITRNEDKQSLFYKPLPPLVEAVLLIEQAHRPEHLEVSIQIVRKKKEDAHVAAMLAHRKEMEAGWRQSDWKEGYSKETSDAHFEARSMLLQDDEDRDWNNLQEKLRIDEAQWRKNPAEHANLTYMRLLASIPTPPAPAPTGLRA